MKTICASGHRAGTHGLDFSSNTFFTLVSIAHNHLNRLKPDVVISGMALGWDQSVATAAIGLGIPVHAYIPFNGQSDRWSKYQCEEYSKLLHDCAVVRIISPGGYSPAKFQKRNEAMVDDSEMTLALWDGTKSGTANHITYAEIMGQEVRNVWAEWEELSSLIV